MIRLESIGKSFGRVRAVDGLSLHMNAGEVFGLLGPNGAGKTTTISIATGLLAPDEGTALVHGHDPRHASARSAIGVAPQALALYDELTGRENLDFFAAIYNLHGSERAERVQEALTLVTLVDRQHDRVQGYSGGMKRRLNLAAAVLHRPAVVFMDEPTAGVDPHARHAIFEIVGTLKSRGCTVVYSTHYMEEAERLCDRVAIIDAGKVLAIDTVAGLLGRYGGQSVLEFSRDGEGGRVERMESADPIAALTQAAAGGRLQSARIHGPTLESVFLTLTGRSPRD